MTDVLIDNGNGTFSVTDSDLVDNGDGTYTYTPNSGSTPPPTVIPLLATPEQLEITPGDRLAFASARVRAYCGWHIAPSITTTESLDTLGGAVLFLRTMHLTNLVNVALADPLADPIDVATLTWSAVGLVARSIGYSWPVGFRAVEVIYEHGFTVVPPEVVEVVVGLASRMPAQLSGVMQESAGGVSRSYGAPLGGGFSGVSGFTIAETNVLAKYRLGQRP